LAAEEALQISLSGEPGPEQALLDRAREGDMEAFESLYREHSGRVHALCLRMSGNATLAADLTQEAFIRAWEKLGSFRGESRFSSWLHRLTVNVVLGERRARGRREARVVDDGELAEKRSETGIGVARIAARTPEPGRRADLEQAIAGLPREARRILVMHDVEGYRHQEISEMTGRSLGTCKSQLHRARKLLRERLGR
jgi:RNA polymerase sigma-70 factor (ECF subfamily)